ncbi:MAG: hypothetical protein CMI62_06165 [Parvibaculum sp.]|nr:hypothetical protein [Parvibaculum sp.]
MAPFPCSPDLAFLQVLLEMVCLFYGTKEYFAEIRMVNVNSLLQVSAELAKMAQKTAEMPRELFWGECRCAG